MGKKATGKAKKNQRKGTAKKKKKKSKQSKGKQPGDLSKTLAQLQRAVQDTTLEQRGIE